MPIMGRTSLVCEMTEQEHESVSSGPHPSSGYVPSTPEPWAMNVAALLHVCCIIDIFDHAFVMGSRAGYLIARGWVCGGCMKWVWRSVYVRSPQSLHKNITISRAYHIGGVVYTGNVRRDVSFNLTTPLENAIIP